MTSIEYALIAALLAIAIIVAVTLLGTRTSGLYNNIATHVSSPSGS